jgi:hypothetical protein
VSNEIVDSLNISLCYRLSLPEVDKGRLYEYSPTPLLYSLLSQVHAPQMLLRNYVVAVLKLIHLKTSFVVTQKEAGKLYANRASLQCDVTTTVIPVNIYHITVAWPQPAQPKNIHNIDNSSKREIYCKS